MLKERIPQDLHNNVKTLLEKPESFTTSEKLEVLASIIKRFYSNHTSIMELVTNLQKSNMPIKTFLNPTLLNPLLNDVMLIINGDCDYIDVVPSKYDHFKVDVLLDSNISVSKFDFKLNIVTGKQYCVIGPDKEVDILTEYYDVDFLVKLYLILITI